MKIDLTEETIEMEPGPNLYFMGNIDDYKKLMHVFANLSETENAEIMLDYIFNELKPYPVKVIFKAKKDAIILSRIREGNVIMELDSQLWKQVTTMVAPLSEKKAHNYIEFDNLILEADCNIIMSSEW